MRPLNETTHQHDRAILRHLERLPVLADMTVDGLNDEFRARFDDECAFVTGQLVPHVQAVETALYPELERLLKDLHSLEPMRIEHVELTRLARALGRYDREMAKGRLGLAEQTGLRRTLYRLYAILKVHLAEEQLFVGVLDGGLTDRQKAVLARALAHATAEPL